MIQEANEEIKKLEGQSMQGGRKNVAEKRELKKVTQKRKQTGTMNTIYNKYKLL